MPLYQYRCPSGHTGDHLHRFSDGERPDSVPCATPGCQQTAGYVFAPPAATMGCKPAPPPSPASRPMTGITLHDYRCPSCQHVFEEVNDWSAGELSTSGRRCPSCGEQAVLLPGGQAAAWSVKMFCAEGGYFDRGLGQHIHSAQEREAVMRERGLVSYDDEGDGWVDREFGRQLRERAEEDQRLADYDDRLAHHPAFAGWRRHEDMEAQRGVR